jgi:hypothetical protein
MVEGPPIASASSVTLGLGEIFRVTGTTQINTINAPLGTMQNQTIWLIPTDPAGVTLGTSGNILIGIAAAQNRTVQLIWLKSQQKWFLENGV